MDLSKLSDAELDALEKSLTAEEAKVPKPTVAGEVGHGVGLTARAGGRAVSGVLGLGDFPLNAILSMVGGKGRFNTPQMMEGVMNDLGVSQPRNGLENATTNIASAMAGAGGVSKAADMVKGAGPATQQIAELLGKNPGTQVLAAGLGGTGAEGAKAGGMGEMGQMTAAMLASLLGTPTLQAAGKFGSHPFEPYSTGGVEKLKGRVVNDAVGPRRQSVIDALGEEQPGSLSTAAEKATPAGSTELSGLEKLLAGKYDPSGYRDRAMAQTANAPPTYRNGNSPRGPENTDASRAELNEEMGHKGAAKAAQVLKQAMQMGQQDVPPMLERKVMIARAVMNRLTGTATDKTLRPLTQDMKDPEVIRKLMLANSPEDKLAIMQKIALMLAGSAHSTGDQ